MRRMGFALTVSSALLTTAPSHMFAQEARAPQDTLAAADSARLAAKKDLLFPYFVGGFIGTPYGLGTLLALSAGEKPVPVMAVGPAILIITARQASKSHLPLPAELEQQLQGKDSAYAAVFRRTYDKAVSKRRGFAIAMGGLAGIISSIALLAYAFRNWD